MSALTAKEKLDLNQIQIDLVKTEIMDLSKKLCILLDQEQKLKEEIQNES